MVTISPWVTGFLDGQYVLLLAGDGQQEMQFKCHEMFLAENL